MASRSVPAWWARGFPKNRQRKFHYHEVLPYSETLLRKLDTTKSRLGFISTAYGVLAPQKREIIAQFIFMPDSPLSRAAVLGRIRVQVGSIYPVRRMFFPQCEAAQRDKINMAVQDVRVWLFCDERMLIWPYQCGVQAVTSWLLTPFCNVFFSFHSSASKKSRRLLY